MVVEGLGLAGRVKLLSYNMNGDARPSTCSTMRFITLPADRMVSRQLPAEPGKLRLLPLD